MKKKVTKTKEVAIELSTNGKYSTLRNENRERKMTVLRKNIWTNLERAPRLFFLPDTVICFFASTVGNAVVGCRRGFVLEYSERLQNRRNTEK